MVTLTASVAQSAPVLQVCSPSVLPPGWVPGQVTAALRQTSSTNIISYAPMLCSGTVVIVDGCHSEQLGLDRDRIVVYIDRFAAETKNQDQKFKVQNFTFSGGLQPQWYGGVEMNNEIVDVNSVRLAVMDVPASYNTNTELFTLIQTPGSSYNFFTFNQIKIVDIAAQQAICVARLPYQISS
ncbi:hypothetical protein HDU76_002280 [Blyttiomyces sp. JEL0837]|nr:hypothetical protein HDU76_002280 [Blyttiomyces sp. JEL0837]